MAEMIYAILSKRISIIWSVSLNLTMTTNMKTEIVDTVEWIIPDLKYILGPEKYEELHPDIVKLFSPKPSICQNDKVEFCSTNKDEGSMRTVGLSPDETLPLQSKV